MPVEAALPLDEEALPPAELSAGASTMVFHSPQAGHLPIHFADSLPQELQYHTLFFAAILPFKFSCTIQRNAPNLMQDSNVANNIFFFQDYFLFLCVQN